MANHHGTIDLGDMTRASKEASALLKVLASRPRLMIVCHLLGGERSVGELIEALGMSQSSVSQHLALLRSEGVVTTRRKAQTIWYSIYSEPASRVIATLHGIFCSANEECSRENTQSHSGDTDHA